MRKIQVFALSAFVLAVFLASPAVSVAESGGGTVAVVELKRCIVESKRGKAIKDEFEQKSGKMDQRAKAIEKEAREIASDMERQGALLTDAVKREKQEKFLALRDEMGKLEMQKRNLNDELTLKVVKDVQVIIKKLADEKGLTMVINDGGPWLLYASDKIDITTEVIAAYDKANEGK